MRVSPSQRQDFNINGGYGLDGRLQGMDGRGAWHGPSPLSLALSPGCLVSYWTWRPEMIGSTALSSPGCPERNEICSVFPPHGCGWERINGTKIPFRETQWKLSSLKFCHPVGGTLIRMAAGRQSGSIVLNRRFGGCRATIKPISR